MKETFSLRISFIIISLLILFTYSSEIYFMPNYIDRPDKWHLLVPMIVFYSALILNIIWTLLKKNIGIQKREILICALITLFGFAMLNSPKGISQILGYSIVFTMFIVKIGRLIIKHKLNNE